MNALTDAFDLALQVREDVLNRIFHAMHTAGTIDHYYVRAFADQRVELQIGSPRITLVTAPSTDGKMRAVATAPVYYHSRPLADAGATGTSAVAEVGIRAVITISTGDPAPLASDTDLVVDWRETSSPDINVLAGPAPLVAEVKAAVLDFIERENGGRFALPPLGTSAQPIGSIAFRFLDTTTALGSVIASGLNVGTAVKGSKNGLQQPFIQQDWALAVSSDFVLAEIRAALQQQFSALPPPFGSDSVTVSDEIVCTINSPWGCVDHARQRVFLDMLNVTLEPGAIVFSGSVRQHTNAWYVPDLSATWTARATLGVAADQTLTVNLSQPQVQINEWYGQVANFLSDNALTNLVASGVRSALQSGAQPGTLSEFFSPQTLRQLGSLGGTGALAVAPTASSVEIRPEAIIVHGTVAVGQTSANPHAALAALNSSSSAMRQILHGGSSWAPGGKVTAYQWDFGDGQSEKASGTSTHFVTDHLYGGGTYRACLTVTDDTGRTATTCRWLTPGQLQLRRPKDAALSDQSEWELCDRSTPFDVRFAVASGDEAVPNALVTVSGSGGQQTGWTDSDGTVVFHLTPDEFTTHGVGPPHLRSFNLGAIHVAATKSGYQSAQHDLWMSDCASIFATIEGAKAHWAKIVDRLIGLELLKQLREGGFTFGVGVDPQDDPRASQLRDLAIGLDVVKGLVQLVESDSAVVSMTKLLGVSGEGPEVARAIAGRLDGALHTISSTIDELEQTPPGGGGPERPINPD